MLWSKLYRKERENMKQQGARADLRVGDFLRTRSRKVRKTQAGVRGAAVHGSVERPRADVASWFGGESMRRVTQ